MSMEKRIKYIDPPTPEEELASILGTIKVNGLVFWTALFAEVVLRSQASYAWLSSICVGWLLLNLILVFGSVMVRWNPPRRSVRVRKWEFKLYLANICWVFVVCPVTDAGWWYLAGVVAHYIPLVILELRTLRVISIKSDMESSTKKDIG